MPAIRTSERRAQAESPLCKIQPIADAPAHSVIRHPAHIFLANAALQHQVLDKPSDRIVRKGCDHRGFEPKAASKAAGDVVLASTFPHPKMTSRRDALIARIEAQHDL